MLSSSLMGRDSTIVAKTTIRMVADMGKTSKALATPTTNHIEPSREIFTDHGQRPILYPWLEVRRCTGCE